MIRSLYTAATGMIAQQQDQDVVANNLANMNTYGFKKSRANFQDLMYHTLTKSGALSSTGTQLPGGIEIGMGTKMVSTQKIFSQGDFTSTENQLDWAIEGEGLFQIDSGKRQDALHAGREFQNQQGFEYRQSGRSSADADHQYSHGDRDLDCRFVRRGQCHGPDGNGHADRPDYPGAVRQSFGTDQHRQKPV